MKKRSQKRGYDYGLLITSLGLTIGIAIVLVRRFMVSGQDWMIFAAGIIVVVTLAVLWAVFGPRWHGR